MRQTKQIPGYPGYFCDRYGTVVSRKRKKEHVLRPSMGTDGYWQYCLVVNGKQSCIGGHRAIALAWIKTDNFKLQVNHKNGVKTDNRIGNLEWVTQSQNAKHQRSVLKIGIGETAPNNRHSEKTMRRVLKLRASGLCYRVIAEKTGVPMGTIGRLCNGYDWTHLT